MRAQLLHRVWFFVTPGTVARQAPPSMGFSRQEYWNRLPFPPPAELPDQGSNPGLLHCRWILYHWATWEAQLILQPSNKAKQKLVSCIKHLHLSIPSAKVFRSTSSIVCLFRLVLCKDSQPWDPSFCTWVPSFHLEAVALSLQRRSIPP